MPRKKKGGKSNLSLRSTKTKSVGGGKLYHSIAKNQQQHRLKYQKIKVNANNRASISKSDSKRACKYIAISNIVHITIQIISLLVATTTGCSQSLNTSDYQPPLHWTQRDLIILFQLIQYIRVDFYQNGRSRM